MNKFFITIIMLFACFLTLVGQEQDIKKALKKGKKTNGYYIAYPSLVVDDYNKWEKKNTQYKILGTEKAEMLVFGAYKPCITEIRFIPVGELQEYENYLEEQAKIAKFKSAASAKERIELRKQYPDYRITNLSDDDICRLFVKQANFFDFERYFDKALFLDFITTFPEYKTSATIKQVALKNIPIPKFLQIYEDYPLAKEYALGNKLAGLSVPQFVDIFKDKESAKRYALDNQLAGLSLKEFVDIFMVKTSAKRYALDNHLAGATLKQFVEIFDDTESAKRYVYSIFASKELTYKIYTLFGNKTYYHLSYEDMPTFIEITNDYKSIEQYICETAKSNYNLWDTEKALRDWLKWVQSTTYMLKGHISLNNVNTEIERAENWIESEKKYAEKRYQEYQEKQRIICANCEVDWKESSFAYNEEKEHILLPGTYTQRNPGKIMMKNGSEYTFYKEDNGKWYISFFLGSMSFKNTDEMIRYFLKECTDQYCR